MNTTVTSFDLTDSTLAHGSYVYNNHSMTLHHIVNYSPAGFLDYTAIKCKDTCPKPVIPDGERETIVRLWSDINNWPN